MAAPPILRSNGSNHGDQPLNIVTEIHWLSGPNHFLTGAGAGTAGTGAGAAAGAGAGTGADARAGTCAGTCAGAGATAGAATGADAGALVLELALLPLLALQ